MQFTITVPLDYLGTLGQAVLTQSRTATTKRGRKAALRQIVQIISMANLLPAKAEVLTIGEGVNYLGDKTILIHYQLDSEVSPEGSPE